MRMLAFPVMLSLLLPLVWSGCAPAESQPLRQKAAQLRELIQLRQEQGRDVSEALALAAHVKELADARRLQEAERELDRALALLADEPAAGGRGDTGQEHAGSAETAGFGPPRPVEIVGYDDDAMEPFVSRDGGYLFWNNRNETGPGKDTNIHWAERIRDDRFRYRGELPGVNSPALDGVPTLDLQGNFYFVSPRSYAQDGVTLYRGRFEGGRVSDVQPLTELASREPGWYHMGPEISPDGKTLYYVAAQPGSGGVPRRSRIQVARLRDGRFVPEPRSAEIFASISSEGLEYAPCISSDGRELLFTRLTRTREGPRFQILRATRKAPSEPFGAPELVDVDRGFLEAPSLTGDGRRLYYHKRSGGRFRLFVAERAAAPPPAQRVSN